MKAPCEQVFLGIDYGERRIGLAKSDPSGLIASALTTLEVKSRRDGLAQLRRIINDVKPDALVVGYPYLPSGDVSDKCREVDRFIELLEVFYDGPIHRVDESYSSVEASEVIHAHGQKVGRDKKRLDRLAAVVILQRFLDERPH